MLHYSNFICFIFRLVKKNRIIIVIISSTLVFGAMSYYQTFLMMRYSDSIIKHKSVETFVILYYESFTNPIESMKQNPLEMLIGTGHLVEKNTQYSSILSNIESNELGFLSLTIKYGAILVSIIIASFLVHTFKLLRFVRKSIISKVEENTILWSFCVTLPLVVSLVHYNSIFKPGIMQLLAAVIALPYVLRKKKEEKNKKQGTSPSQTSRKLIP